MWMWTLKPAWIQFPRKTHPTSWSDQASGSVSATQREVVSVCVSLLLSVYVCVCVSVRQCVCVFVQLLALGTFTSVLRVLYVWSRNPGNTADSHAWLSVFLSLFSLLFSLCPFCYSASSPTAETCRHSSWALIGCQRQQSANDTAGGRSS